VLLVEDHRPTRTTLANLLSRRHFEVVTADCLAEAQAIAAKSRFDLLISDIGLPDGSGYDLMRSLRGSSKLVGIALTGYGMEEDIEKSRSAGFLSHLTKPVSMQALDFALAEAAREFAK
jgi:CheY-like chemotaxis protein